MKSSFIFERLAYVFGGAAFTLLVVLTITHLPSKTLFNQHVNTVDDQAFSTKMMMKSEGVMEEGVVVDEDMATPPMARGLGGGAADYGFCSFFHCAC